MKLKKIHIKNFKSLKDVEIDDIEDLNIFIGKNNSGKSNILDVLNFVIEAYRTQGGIGKVYDNRGGFKELVYGKDPNEEIQISFTFTISDEDRRKIIRACIGNDVSHNLETLINSNFFKHLTYHVVLGQNKVVEEIKISNVLSGEITIYIWEGSLTSYKILSSNLEQVFMNLTTASNITEELSILIDTNYLPSGGRTRLLLLGDVNGGLYYAPRADTPPPEEMIALLVRKFSNKHVWVSPIRKSSDKLSISGTDALGPDANNLADFLHTYSTSKPESYRKFVDIIKKIIPEVENILTPTIRILTPTIGSETTISIKESGFPEITFTLDSLSSGVREILAIIAHLIFSPEDFLICIEEPEIHLYPKAQRELLKFLKEESKSKTIFITTHSPIFASGTEVENLRLVTKNEDGITTVEKVDESNVYKIIEELGVKPSDFFDDDVVVFVEGSDDVGIFKAFAKKLKSDSKIGFIDSEGWNSMGYYANAKILESKKVKIPIFVIFDGGIVTEKKYEAIVKKLLKQLDLEKDHLIILGENSIENYLLAPRAIETAFPTLKKSKEEIENFLKEHEKKKDKKKVLDCLFREGDLGKYSGGEGARIVEAMNDEEINGEIHGIICKLEKANLKN